MPQAIINRGSSTLLSVQAARAIAAILVLLFHDSVVIFATKKLSDAPFDGFFNFGNAGIYFFFVLSGFIILHAHWNDLGQQHRLAAYLWKRFRRIYPVYWIVLLAIAPVYFLVPGLAKAIRRSPAF